MSGSTSTLQRIHFNNFIYKKKTGTCDTWCDILMYGIVVSVVISVAGIKFFVLFFIKIPRSDKLFIFFIKNLLSRPADRLNV